MMFLMRMFAPKTYASKCRVDAQQERLNTDCAIYHGACAQAEKATAEIKHTIFAGNISQQALGVAQQEYIKKEKESGLHKGVGGDAPVTK
jgi:hypothetical protein